MEESTTSTATSTSPEQKPETEAMEAARAAAVTVPGVHDLGSTLRRRLSGSVRRVQGSRLVSATGMSAEVGRGEIAIDLGLVIDYGSSAPEVSDRVRHAVTDAVHTRTGLDVVRVDVGIDDLKLPEAEQERWDEDLRRLAAEQADRVRQIAGDSARRVRQQATEAADRATEKASEARDAAVDAARSAAVAVDASVERLDETTARPVADEPAEPVADLAAEIVDRLQETPQEKLTVTETTTVVVEPGAADDHAPEDRSTADHQQGEHREG